MEKEFGGVAEALVEEGGRQSTTVAEVGWSGWETWED